MNFDLKTWRLKTAAHCATSHFVLLSRQLGLFISFFIVFFSFSIAKAQSNPDSLIKKLKIVQITINQGERIAGIIKYDTVSNRVDYKYDDFASSTMFNTFSSDTYNRDNQIIESKSIRSSSTHSSFHHDTVVWNYQYDANKNLTAIKDSKAYIIFSYEYNPRGGKTKELMPDTLGKIITETDFKYDDNGNVIEEIMKIMPNMLRFNKTYYDTMNRKIKSESIENNHIRFADSFLYDPNSKLLIKEVYDEDGSGTQIDGVIYKYDNKKRLITRQHFNSMNGKEEITGEENFEYFDNNLIKKYSENIFSINHTKRTFTYSYKFNNSN